MCVRGGYLSHLSFCTMIQNIWPLAESLCECGSLGLVSTETFLYHMTIIRGILINFFSIHYDGKFRKLFLSLLPSVLLVFLGTVQQRQPHTQHHLPRSNTQYIHPLLYHTIFRHVWTPFHDVFSMVALSHIRYIVHNHIMRKYNNKI